MATAFDSWLGIIIPCAGFGAIIDFYLGKTGQKRVKERIEAWWIQLSDVSINTFGRDEARMAYQLLLKVFGTFFSLRRYAAIAVGLLIAAPFVVMKLRPLFFTMFSMTFQAYLIPAVIIGGLLATSLSISLTMWLTRRVSLILSKSVIINASIYALTIFSAYLAIAIPYMIFYVVVKYSLYPSDYDDSPGAPYRPFIHLYIVYRTFLVDSDIFHKSPFSLFEFIEQLFSYARIELIIGRLLLSASFLVSVLFKPVQRFLLATMLKLVELDKPAFTVIFGFIGGAGKFIKDML